MNEHNWIFSKAANRMGSSIIREILKMLETKEIISLGGAVPDPKLFPLKEISEATHNVLKNNGAEALQYSSTQGYLPLRKFIAKRAQKQGIKATAENVLITNGSQQGLDLVCKIFINPGDTVVTEQPTYLGFIQSVNTYQAKFLSLPIDEDGLQVDLLENALKNHHEKPVLLYLLPNFQNPSGVTLSLARRKEIARLAQKHQIPILEDDPYSELHYYGTPLPSLKSFKCADITITLGTISKTITPGHRLGWVIADTEVIKKLALAKQATDLHTSTFAQWVIYEFCRQGHMDKHIKYLCAEYAKKRNAMLSAMEKYFPADIKWTKPTGGLFVWVSLPVGLYSTKILKDCIENKVAFVPGSAFYTDGSGNNTLRLSFSNVSIE